MDKKNLRNIEDLKDQLTEDLDVMKEDILQATENGIVRCGDTFVRIVSKWITQKFRDLLSA